MAKILVCAKASFFENTPYELTNYFDQFIAYLKGLGNEILFIDTFNVLEDCYYSSNNVKETINLEALLEIVKSFDPEVIFAFNNNLPKGIFEVTTCPIVAWMADSLYMFNDIDHIFTNKDRYKIFVFSKAYISKIERMGFNPNHIFYIENATSIVAEPIEKSININFIGTLFQVSPGVSSYLMSLQGEKRQQMLNQIDKGFETLDSDIAIRNYDEITNYCNLDELFALKTPANRLFTLNEIASLGLSLYGSPNWSATTMARLFPYIAMSYNSERVFTKTHLSSIYNKSKISLSIAHDQALDGFPWRVLDILASNSVLLSDYRYRLSEITQHFKLPMYKSPQEAKDIAKQLLNDEKHREELVIASQELVNSKYRWEHRTKDIEEALGFSISDGDIGEVLILNEQNLRKN